MKMRYTEDRVINRSTDNHPGPWLAKQRVYQTKADKQAGKDWYHVREQAYDALGVKIDDSEFWISSGLFGTREWLMLEEDEPILTVKKMFY